MIVREVLWQTLFYYLKCQLNPLHGDKLYTSDRVSLLQERNPNINKDTDTDAVIILEG